MLVFPSHSVENINVNYNIKYFAQKINRIKKEKEFNTVTICLYFIDIIRGLGEKYGKYDFKVVTAGLRDDSFFLNRLKTIIELSDFTLSNGIGTHIGYCIYLEKPHFIIPLELKYSENEDNYKEFNRTRNITRFNQIQKEKREIFEIFSKFNTKITDRQIKICSKYWGFEEIKTPKELREIFMILRYIVKNSNKTEEGYKKIVDKLIKKSKTKKDIYISKILNESIKP